MKGLEFRLPKSKVKKKLVAWTKELLDHIKPSATQLAEFLSASHDTKRPRSKTKDDGRLHISLAIISDVAVMNLESGPPRKKKKTVESEEEDSMSSLYEPPADWYFFPERSTAVCSVMLPGLDPKCIKATVGIF